LIIGLRMNADSSADRRRCSSSGRCVQAVGFHQIRPEQEVVPRGEHLPDLAQQDLGRRRIEIADVGAQEEQERALGLRGARIAAGGIEPGHIPRVVCDHRDVVQPADGLGRCLERRR
jgi:hypothetical protein